MKVFSLAKLSLRRSALAAGILVLTVFSNPSTSNREAVGIPPSVLNFMAASGNFMAAYGAEAVTLDRNSRDFKLPEQIKWEGRPGNDTQSATLFGDPSKPGIYVQLLKRGANNWSQPHSHPNDRFITVLAGTMWIGTGAKFDPEHTVPLKPGGFVRDIANQIHYDGTKEDGLTIEIVGMGPATSIQAAPK